MITTMEWFSPADELPATGKVVLTFIDSLGGCYCCAVYYGDDDGGGFYRKSQGIMLEPPDLWAYIEAPRTGDGDATHGDDDEH